jgi:hypothetical protein
VGQRNWKTRGRADLPTVTSSLGREGRFSRVRDNEGKGEQAREQCPDEIDLREFESESWTETINLAPRVKQIVVGKVELPKGRANPS